MEFKYLQQMKFNYQFKINDNIWFCFVNFVKTTRENAVDMGDTGASDMG